MRPATPRGRRDAAVVLVLLRLGLRAGEVARLRLEDVDWRHGEVAIRGKGGRGDQLPLPVEVGEAIAAYLHGGRPPGSGARCPHGHGSDSAAVSRRRRQPRAPGLRASGRRPCRTAHAARTLATETLRAGAPMSEVAQLLRHADQATSSVYAAADVAAVAALAQPWPEVRG